MVVHHILSGKSCPLSVTKSVTVVHNIPIYTAFVNSRYLCYHRNRAMGLRPGTRSNVVARKRRHSVALNEVIQIGVRLEEGLRRRLERVASQRGQSMNAEIVERLQRSFQNDEDKT